MSRDYVIVIYSRKQKKQASFLLKENLLHTESPKHVTNTASIYRLFLSFSFCHHATSEALLSTSTYFQFIYKIRTTSCGNRIIRLSFS